MKTLIVLSAPPGCGKSTWAREYRNTHPNTYIISSDEIRYELTGQLQDFSKQKEVWELFSLRIHEYAKKGEDVTVILDALCDLNSLREMYVRDNPEYDKYVLVLFPHTLEDMKRLNQMRDASQVVPEDVLITLYNKFEEPTERILNFYDEVLTIEF